MSGGAIFPSQIVSSPGSCDCVKGSAFLEAKNVAQHAEIDSSQDTALGPFRLSLTDVEFPISSLIKHHLLLKLHDRPRPQQKHPTPSSSTSTVLESASVVYRHCQDSDTTKILREVPTSGSVAAKRHFQCPETRRRRDDSRHTPADLTHVTNEKEQTVRPSLRISKQSILIHTLFPTIPTCRKQTPPLTHTRPQHTPTYPNKQNRHHNVSRRLNPSRIP